MCNRNYPIALRVSGSSLVCLLSFFYFEFEDFNWTCNKAFRDESLFESNVSIEDLQKKIIPWHALLPRQEDLDDYSLEKSSGLILVSSLIDKGTNLGGICRTCEIFNVKELVIGSIKYTEDKLFQNLAVTAENWLNIKEVSYKLKTDQKLTFHVY